MQPKAITRRKEKRTKTKTLKKQMKLSAASKQKKIKKKSYVKKKVPGSIACTLHTLTEGTTQSNAKDIQLEVIPINHREGQTQGSISKGPHSTGPSVLFRGSATKKKAEKNRNISKHFNNKLSLPKGHAYKATHKPSPVQHMINRNPLTNASRTHEINHSIIPKALRQVVLVKGSTSKISYVVSEECFDGFGVILGAAALIDKTTKEHKN